MSGDGGGGRRARGWWLRRVSAAVAEEEARGGSGEPQSMALPTLMRILIFSCLRARLVWSDGAVAEGRKATGRWRKEAAGEMEEAAEGEGEEEGRGAMDEWLKVRLRSEGAVELRISISSSASLGRAWEGSLGGGGRGWWWCMWTGAMDGD